MSKMFSGRIKVIDDSGELVSLYILKDIDYNRWKTIEKDRVVQYLDAAIRKHTKKGGEANGD